MMIIIFIIMIIITSITSCTSLSSIKHIIIQLNEKYFNYLSSTYEENASSVSGRRYDDNHYRDDRCNNTDYNDNMMKKKQKHQ